MASKLTALLAGAFLTFGVRLAFEALLPVFDWGVVLTFMAVSYACAGGALGLLWPRPGWRLGLWLTAFWLLLIPLGILFSGSAPVDLGRDFKNLLERVIIVIAACFGAEVGAIIGRQRGQQTAATKD